MSTTGDAPDPNTEQRAFWNESGGLRWVAEHRALDERLEPFGQVAMEAAGVKPGEDVLDVGCGCGSTTVELGRRVGERGSVLGLDFSEVMLDVARKRGAGANVRFECGDAQVHPLAADGVDLIFSRFGVMFFADPPRAFANLAHALRRGGRVAFICWQGLQKNPWMAVPMSVAAQHVRAPEPPRPGAPGPLSLADPDLVREILGAAGLADVRIAPLERDMHLGDDLDQSVAFLMQRGPAGRMLADADEDTRARVAQALHESLGPFVGKNGVELGSASWVVTARGL